MTVMVCCGFKYFADQRNDGEELTAIIAIHLFSTRDDFFVTCN